MAKLFLVRHGKSAAGFHEAVDAGLSDLGHMQAAKFAERAAAELKPMRILASPMQRAMQTAGPLALRWHSTVGICPVVTEIPVPDELDGPNLAARRPWLDRMLGSHYGVLDRAIEDWRTTLLNFLSGQSEDAVIFTHYLTINAVIGAATGDSRLAPVDIGYCQAAEISAGASGLSYIGILGGENL